MSNLALLSFRVEWHGEYWVVFPPGGSFFSVRTPADLARVLRGQEALEERPKRQRREETTEEFLARGGKIQHASPEATSDPKDWTLESLGLL